MTISSESRKSPLYVGSGTTGPFAFTFKVFAASDVRVTTAVIATGVETTLTLTTDYTVSLNAEQDGNPGGTITLTSSLPATKSLVITSAVPLTQPVDINNQDGFFAEVIEDALDRSVVQVQQMQVDLDRAFKVPLTSGYTDPNEFITDLLNTDAAAQAARVGAEAAETAAVAAQTAAESAQAGAETAETNAESYVNTVAAATSTVYANYAAAIAALGAGDDGTVFRLAHQGRYYVYVYTESGDYGVLQYVVPVDGIDATIASAASGGVTPSGQSIPSGALVDVVSVDSLYSHTNIRNRAVTGKPDDSSPILRNTNVAEEPLRGHITPQFLNLFTGSPSATAGTVTFGSDAYGDYVQMNYLGTAVIGGNMRVKLPVDPPPGRYTLSYDYWSDIAAQSFVYSVNGGSSWSALSASETQGSVTATINKTDFASVDLILCADDGNVTLAVGSATRVRINNIVLRPGTATTYTPPAVQHPWHRRSWNIESGKFVDSNDNSITDKMHFLAPLNEEREFDEVTVSVAIKPTSNDPYQVTNVVAPTGQPFSILNVPSYEFLSDIASANGTAGGYIGFNGLGSVDDVVQVTEVAPPLDKWSILTVVCPKEQGVNSDPVRIYLNGILLREVRDLIRVKTTARTNDASTLRFDFGNPHWFVEDQPVTVTVADIPGGAAGAFPGNIEEGVTYYVRLPAENPQERLFLSTTPASAGTNLVAHDGAGAGFVFVQSQRRNVGVVPFTASLMSLLGAGNFESIVAIDAAPFDIIRGLNLQGEFANAVVYDRALTDTEVVNLAAAQKQRVASHYEAASSLGSVLLCEGDSITFGVGTTSPSDTFRYRLFYGLEFNKRTVTAIGSTRNEKTIASAVEDTNAQQASSVVNADGKMRWVFSNPHFFYTGDKVRLTTTGTLPTGVSTGTDYYVQRINSTRLDLATTADPEATPIAWGGDDGTGDHTITLEDGRLKLTFGADHNYLDATSTPDAVIVFTEGGTLPGGLSGGVTYYVRYRDATSLYLTTTTSLTSIPIGYVSAGSGTNKISWTADKIELTFASAHGYATQDSVQVKTTNTLPAGLDDQEIIYARKLSNTKMSLGFPLPGNVVNAGSTGFGTMTVQEFIPELKNDASKLSNILLATSGSTIQFTLDREPEMLDKIQRVVADGSRPIVIYMAGINDLVAGITPTQMDQKIVELALYWQRLRDAGAKVIVCTVTAANPAYFAAYSEANRNLYNTKLRLASPYYDALADFADTPQLSGPWAEPGPLSYYFDDIHPDFRAHIVMSNILSPLVDAFRLG